MNKTRDISGIYKITSPTGKVYVGRSYRIKERWRSYRRMSCKDQSKLFASFTKHGTDAHKFEIIHELPNDVSQGVIENYEILYSELYKGCNIELLNIAPTGRGIGRLKDYQSEKAGAVHRGKPSWNKGKFGKDHNRSIQITCNGVVYGSMSEASRITGIGVSTIHAAIKENRACKNMHFQLSTI